MTSNRTSTSTVATETTVATQKETTMNTIEKMAQASERAASTLTLEERIALHRGTMQVKKAEKVAEKAAKASAPKPPKAEKVLPLCGCGCGERTGGGIYRPGHDAKHKSALFILAKNGDEAAIATLEGKGWLHLMAIPKAKAEAKISRKAQWEAIEADADEFARQLASLPIK